MLKEQFQMEQRHDAAVAVICDGMTVSKVAQKLGISGQSVYRWMARYEAGGIEALHDRSHRPTGDGTSLMAVSMLDLTATSMDTVDPTQIRSSSLPDVTCLEVGSPACHACGLQSTPKLPPYSESGGSHLRFALS